MKKNNNGQKPLWRITENERRFILLVGDALVASIALIIALYFWAMKDLWMDFTWQFLLERPPNWYYLLPFIWLLLLIELYDTKTAGRRGDTIRGITASTIISTFLYLLIFFISEPKSLPRRGVAAFIAAAAGLTILWRLLYIRIFTAPVFLRRVIIIGAGRAGSTLAEEIIKMEPQPFNLVGFVDDDKEKIGKKIVGVPVLGSSKELIQIIENEHASDLIFSISGDMQPTMYSAILAAEEKGVEVNTMPVVYEELMGRIPIALLADDWVLRSFVDRAHASGSYELIKRLFDIVGSLFGLIFLALVYPLIALMIIVDDGFPILFRQIRMGKSGKKFVLYKFRSMKKDAEKDGIARFAVENDDRVTRVGGFLRKSHLDEIPQFINVIKGDVTLVGPRAERPEMVEDLQKDIPFYRARLFIKPGVTGWAQINYGYASNIEETAIKLEHDLYYIMHRNLMLDLMIIFKTLGAVVGFRGL
ncbi:MAG: sugar transferase [Anaerolineaceae bacterium]|nr:sugar transferase [Anaerolineaceae bacterium]